MKDETHSLRQWSDYSVFSKPYFPTLLDLINISLQLKNNSLKTFLNLLIFHTINCFIYIYFFFLCWHLPEVLFFLIHFFSHMVQFFTGYIYIYWTRHPIPISSFPLKSTQANWPPTPLQREYGTEVYSSSSRPAPALPLWRRLLCIMSSFISYLDVDKPTIWLQAYLWCSACWSYPAMTSSLLHS